MVCKIVCFSMFKFRPKTEQKSKESKLKTSYTGRINAPPNNTQARTNRQEKLPESTSQSIPDQGNTIFLFTPFFFLFMLIVYHTKGDVSNLVHIVFHIFIRYIHFYRHTNKHI